MTEAVNRGEVNHRTTAEPDQRSGHRSAEDAS